MFRNCKIVNKKYVFEYTINLNAESVKQFVLKGLLLVQLLVIVTML